MLHVQRPFCKAGQITAKCDHCPDLDPPDYRSLPVLDLQRLRVCWIWLIRGRPGARPTNLNVGAIRDGNAVDDEGSYRTNFVFAFTRVFQANYPGCVCVLVAGPLITRDASPQPYQRGSAPVPRSRSQDH